jgi:hypothetical protein
MKLLKEDHISHYACVAKGPRHAKRHVFQNYPDDVFRVHIWNKCHLYMIPWEDLPPFFLCIDFVRSDNLDDQITHAKYFSPHHCKKKISMEEKMN